MAQSLFNNPQPYTIPTTTPEPKSYAVTPQAISSDNIPQTKTTDQSSAPVVKNDSSQTSAQGSALDSTLKQIQTELASLQKQSPPAQPPTPTPTSTSQNIWNQILGKQQETQQGVTTAEQAVPTQQQAFNQVMGNYGVDQTTYSTLQSLNAQAQTYQQQLNDLNTQEQNDIDKVQGMAGGTEGFANAQVSQIQRGYATKQAQITSQYNMTMIQASALQGKYDAAQTAAQQLVTSSTQQEQQKVSDLQWGFQQYSSILEGMDTTQQKEAQQVFDNAQTQLNTKQTTIQNGLDTALKFAAAYGSNAPAQLKSIMGQDYIDTLKGYGIDITQLAGNPTLTENKNTAQYGQATSTGIQSVVYNDPNSIAAQNNNPLNIMYTPTTEALGASQGTAGNGGNFASFPNQQTGIDAAIQLLNSPTYQNLTVDQALKLWSNGGYGANITQISGNTPMSSLTSDQQTQLVQDMIQNGEGSGKVLYAQSDIQSLATSIESGQTPPPSGFGANTGKMLQVKAQLAKDGFNLSQATLDWNATTAYISSANSGAQVRLKQAISSVTQAIPQLQADATKWQAGGFAPLNKGNMIAALNGGYGQQAQQIAADFQQQSTIIQDELGQTFMGGNSPTDSALSLAGKVFDTSWSADTLNSALNQLQTNLQFRQNAINQVQVGGLGGSTNIYSPGSTTSGGTSNTDPLGLGL